MKRYDIPRVAFVNKLDRAGANPWRVIEMVRKQMAINASAVQIPVGLEGGHIGVVDIVNSRCFRFAGERGEKVEICEVPDELRLEADEKRLELIERVADVDDALAEAYLEQGVDAITPEVLKSAIRRSTLARLFVPVFMGSAYKNKGVQPLLDGVVDYLPSPIERENVVALAIDDNETEVPVRCANNEPLLALAFKLEESRFGQLTYVRIYRGTLRKGATIVNVRTRKTTKIPRLVRMHADDMEDIDLASAGDVVAIFGIDCASMDTFEDASNAKRLAMSSMFVPRAVISLAIAPKKGSPSNALDNFSSALQRFTREDPTLRVHTDPESKQTIISGMGELHLEVYIERMAREYKVECEVGNPKVHYREAISLRADFDYIHKKQSGGAGQYARVMGYIEPIEEGSLDDDGEDLGVYDFVNSVVGTAIPPEFILSCDKGARDAVAKGNLVGAPVEGIRVVIRDGVTHPVDSSDLAFRTATQVAVRKAMDMAKPSVLEPIMALEVTVPTEFQGDVLGGINQRRGLITSSEVSADGSVATVCADIPLAFMFGYSTDIRSQTQGKGEFTMEYKCHQPVTMDTQVNLIKRYQEERLKKA